LHPRGSEDNVSNSRKVEAVEIAEQLIDLRQRFGVNHLVASVHWPGMPNSLALEQMQILAEEVMPEVRRAS